MAVERKLPDDNESSQNQQKKKNYFGTVELTQRKMMT